MIKGRIHYERKFLNTEGYHELAGLVTQIDDMREDNWESPFYGMYKMSNCERALELTLDFDNEEDLNNTLHKMDTIISVTKAFRDKAESLREDIINYAVDKKAKELVEKGNKDGNTK